MKTRLPRVDSALVYSEGRLQVVPAAELARRVTLLPREEADRLLASFSGAVTDRATAQAFGPGATAS